MVLLKWKSCIAAITFTAISLSASKSALAVSLYSVTDLGNLAGEAYSYATDINDSGEVAINTLGKSFFTAMVRSKQLVRCLVIINLQ